MLATQVFSRGTWKAKGRKQETIIGKTKVNRWAEDFNKSAKWIKKLS